MKKHFLSILLLGFTLSAMAQTAVSVRDIQYVSPTDLANCTDESQYEGLTIKTVGVVMHDGNRVELSSGSVNGGYRPGVHILDTAAHGSMGDFRGVQVHGVFAAQQNQPVTVLDNLVAGMIIEVTGQVSSFSGETQIYPNDNSSVVVLGTTAVPESDTITIGQLNDNNRTNILTTGEAWEGSYVTFENVTVVGVSFFSGGSRVSFDVVDDDGNTINVSDRFLVQKMSSWNTVNASSPQSTGSFSAPVVGTKFASLSGIILHSENGCSGGTGRGYELNPFDTSHYKVGDTPPSISEVSRDPLVPTSSDMVKITAKILDFNGTVTSQSLFYSDDINAGPSAFTELSMTLVGGSTDEFEASIPAFADGTTVRYYIRAEDNDGNLSYEPFAVSSSDSSTAFYTVRDNGLTIVDLQRVLNVNQDASPYAGSAVTVTGCVTASAKPYDLEEIYIQDPTASEWAGIKVTGNSDLLDLWRTEEVEVTGIVQESFGFTQITVSTVTKTGNHCTVDPVELEVSDSAAYASREIEKYEGMLVKMINSGGSVVINNPRLNNFGEWTIASDTQANFPNSTKVQSGIKNSNNNSSLWVSVVSDDTLAETEGFMEVEAIEAEKGMSMDALIGIMYYGFGEYEVKPRNNDDLVNFSEDLDSTNYADTITESIVNWEALGLKMYPNPAHEYVTLDLGTKSGSLRLTDMAGRMVIVKEMRTGVHTLQLSGLKPGVYLATFETSDGTVASTRLLKL